MVNKKQALAVALAEFGMKLGWTTTENTRAIIMHAPIEFHNVSEAIPKTGEMRGTRTQQVVRKLLKYADPEKRVLVVAQLDGDLRDHVTSALADHPEWLARTPKPVPPKTRAHVDQQKLPEDEVITSEGERLPVNPPPRRIVTELPWLAHRGTRPRGGGRRYESHAVIERTWSDSTTDYRCSSASCTVESDDPNFIANHYARCKDNQHPHLNGGDGRSRLEVIDPNYTEPINDRSEQHITRLAERLEAALRGVDLSRVQPGEEAWLARQIAACVVADEPAGGGHRSLLDLTPEEVLARIRTLVDRGEYLSLRTANETLNTELTATRLELEQSQRDTQRVEERWHTLRQIIVEEDDGKQKADEA